MQEQLRVALVQMDVAIAGRAEQATVGNGARGDKDGDADEARPGRVAGDSGPTAQEADPAAETGWVSASSSASASSSEQAVV